MRLPGATIFLAGLIISSLSTRLFSENWDQFRGPKGLGIAPDDVALPAQFDNTTNLIWKTPLSSGHSSPCVWGERIFLTGFSGDDLKTICLNRGTGEILWERKAPAAEIEKVHQIHSPAASTPSSDGEHVFVYFGSYGLLCYDFDGNEQWQRQLPIPKNTFGAAASPIIAGDYLIFNCDTNTESYLEAIDPKTGKTVWRTEREGFRSGWSTPMHWRNDGVDELVVYGFWWLTAYDLKDGSERWAVPGLADEPSITPVTGDGLVFISSYNMKTNPEVIGLPEFATLLRDHDSDRDGKLTREEIQTNSSILSRHDADGEGDHPMRIFFKFLDVDKDEKITAKEWDKIIAWVGGFKHENALVAIRPGGDDREATIAWKYERGVPEIPSPFYYKGLVYMVKNGGIVTCLDAATGELKFQKKLGAGGPYYSSPVVGDGKIYVASARGVVTVFEAGDSFKILARNNLKERIMATPAIVDGRVYVRTDEHMYAFGFSK